MSKLETKVERMHKLVGPAPRPPCETCDPPEGRGVLIVKGEAPASMTGKCPDCGNRLIVVKVLRGVSMDDL